MYDGMQILNSAIETLPKDRNGKISKDYLRVALDVVAPSAALPPFGAIEEVRVLSLRSHLFIILFLHIYVTETEIELKIDIYITDG
jgi:hypothetical protein